MSYLKLILWLLAFWSCTDKSSSHNREYISGINSLDVLSNDRLNKKVYLLGETHTEKGRCPSAVKSVNVAHWIYHLPANVKSKFIDIFLEAIPSLTEEKAKRAVPGASPLPFEPLLSNQSYLAELVNRLRSCFEPTHKCPYPNMRVHWADLRDYIITLFFEEPEAYAAKITLKPAAKSAMSYDALLEFIKHQLLAEGKIRKQWDTVPHQFLHRYLPFVDQELKESERRGEFASLRNEIIEEKDGTLWIWARNYEKVDGLLGDLLAPLTNAYAIGRFLKRFKVNQGSPFPPQANNAIFFFGIDHTKYIKEYLLSIGFKLEQSFRTHFVENGKTSNLCLQVEGLKQPLF